MQLCTRVVVRSLVIFSALVFCSPTVFATAQATITIEQISSALLGSWTLLSASGSTYTSSDVGVNKMRHSIAISEFSPMTLSVVQPPGMSVKLGIYRGDALVKSIEIPQYSFTPYPNDSYRFLVQYSLSRLGSLGITSTPSGVRLRLKGPTAKTYSAVTPFTFTSLPAGRYSVLLSATSACVQPPPHAAVVEPEQRNTLHITMNCDKKKPPEATTPSMKPTKRELFQYVEQRELKSRGERK